MTRAWIEPIRTDTRIREDLARFACAIDPADLARGSAHALHQFAGPVRLVWGNADPYFPMDLARRLAAEFRKAEAHRGRRHAHLRSPPMRQIAFSRGPGSTTTCP